MTSIFDNGSIYLPDINGIIASEPWNKHVKFQGVCMKDIITGTGTEGAFSVHFVKIESRCSIGEHLHEGKAELHEIIAGSGNCFIDGKEVFYSPGDFALIPCDTLHSVTAGDNGLFLIAKFVPALY